MTIFNLLHVILRPTSGIYVTDEITQRKFFKKYTMMDSQKKFMLIAATPDEAEFELKKMKSLNSPIQPFLIIIGTLSQPKYILVYFDEIKYKFYSSLRAINCCFQIFFVFKLDYPIEARTFWTFIQEYFYNITVDADENKIYPSVSCLIAQLRKEKDK